MALDPLSLLREAVRAVPAVKYALGVAGLVAVVAIVKIFDLEPAIAVSGAVITLVLMVALLVFARLTSTASSHFVAPALVFTWGSLVLVLATAGLLFTSAFFKWPVDLDLRKDIGAVIEPPASVPGTNPPATPIRPLAQDPGVVAKIVASQLGSRDYAAAWSTVTEATKQQPTSDVLLDLEARVAAAWVRDARIRVSDGEKFADVVDPLLPTLYRAAQGPKKTAAADALAHIAWANFLKSRDSGQNPEVEKNLREALALDPENAFAHAMLGHWLMVHHASLDETQAHFKAALQSNREREFVLRLQIAALQWVPDSTENSIALIRVCNEMRQNRESLPQDTRSRLVSRIYYGSGGDEILVRLDDILPAGEHLATFRWLTEGMDVSEPGYKKFSFARLTEAAGDCETAARMYVSLLEVHFTKEREVQEGIERCKAKAPQLKSEL